MNAMATERTNYIRRMYSAGLTIPEIIGEMPKEGFAPVSKARMYAIVRVPLAKSAHKYSRLKRAFTAPAEESVRITVADSGPSKA